jgi:hypothetical protein
MKFTRTKTQHVEMFDTGGRIERLDTGTELLGIVVDGSLHLSDDERLYDPSLPDSVGPVEDIVVTDHVCVLGGEDVSRLSSSFRQQATATVEGATRIRRRTTSGVGDRREVPIGWYPSAVHTINCFVRVH